MIFLLCDSMFILCRHNVYDEVLSIKWKVNVHMFTRISFTVLEYYYLMELLSILGSNFLAFSIEFSTGFYCPVYVHSLMSFM